MEADEIYLLKLIDGEQVVCNVEHRDNGLIIKQPLTLFAAGEGKIRFMPFMAYGNTDDGVYVKDTHVVIMIRPHEDLVTQYKEITSGIQLPPTKELITG